MCSVETVLASNVQSNTLSDAGQQRLPGSQRSWGQQPIRSQPFCVRGRCACRFSTVFDTLHEKALYHKIGFVSGDSAQLQPNGSVLSAMKVG